MRIEEFDQLGEVGERAGQPVDLVDDDPLATALDPKATFRLEAMNGWKREKAALG
jgi:hypothetical protein